MPQRNTALMKTPSNLRVFMLHLNKQQFGVGKRKKNWVFPWEPMVKQKKETRDGNWGKINHMKLFPCFVITLTLMVKYRKYENTSGLWKMQSKSNKRRANRSRCGGGERNPRMAIHHWEGRKERWLASWTLKTKIKQTKIKVFLSSPGCGA